MMRFKIKTGCCLELLTYQTKKSFWSTELKITKDENS